MSSEARTETTSEVARHIARTAARLFAAHGYDGTPVSTIVEAAGVTKPTLYYHFGSKEGLAQALLTEPLTQLAADLRASLEAEADPVLGLERMIETHFAFTRDEPDRTRFLFALGFGPTGASLSTELSRSADAICSLFEAAAARLADAGVIDAGRAESCSAALWGLIVVRIMDYLYKGRELSPGLARGLVGDLLLGFAAEGTRGALARRSER